MQEIKRLREIFENQLHLSHSAHCAVSGEAYQLLDQIEEQFKQNEVNILTLKGIVANQKQEIREIFESVKTANNTQTA